MDTTKNIDSFKMDKYSKLTDSKSDLENLNSFQHFNLLKLIDNENSQVSEPEEEKAFSKGSLDLMNQSNILSPNNQLRNTFTNSTSSYRQSNNINESSKSVVKSYQSNLSVFDIEKADGTYNSPDSKRNSENLKFTINNSSMVSILILTFWDIVSVTTDR